MHEEWRATFGPYVLSASRFYVADLARSNDNFFGELLFCFSNLSLTVFHAIQSPKC